jgi:hypothetical protein
MKYLKNINDLISENFKSDQEFDDLLNYLLNNFFSHEKVDLLEEVVENSIISLDFMTFKTISLSHCGFVDGGSSMSASRDLNPVIISGIKSASVIRDRGLWDGVNNWKHLFSSAKDMIIRGAKPYYQYGVNFTIDSGYNGISQNDIIRHLGNYSYSDESIMLRSLISKTIKKELSFEGLNVKVFFGNPASFGGAFVSDVRITDLDYVYNPDLIS